jgi:SAM-dependent methyltransferase
VADDRLGAHLELAELSDEDFVRRAYRLVLRRDPDREALERRLPRATLLRELVESPEFERVRALDEGIARAREAPRFLEAPAGLDERSIEIPWVLARYGGEARVLDVGTANAEPAYVAALVDLGAPELVGVDLAPVEATGVRAVAGDVRDLPFPERSFDLALCVSTLEHVGRDNRVYGADAERDEDGIARALAELARVLDRDGRLLVTVPCGEPEDHGWFVQLDPAGWNELFVESGFRVVEEEVYALGADGWRAAPEFDPAGVRYGDHAAAVLCADLRPRSGVRETIRRLGGLSRGSTGRFRRA